MSTFPNKFTHLFYVLLVLFITSCMSYQTNMFPIEKEQTEDIKSIKIVSDLDPVTTDMVYQIILEMGEYTVVETDPQATLYFSKSHLETHRLSYWNILYLGTIYPYIIGGLYLQACDRLYVHEYYITVRAVSPNKTIQAIFDNKVGRVDCSPTGFITKEQLSKMIMITLKRLRTG